jgi:hypothetical protein
MTKSINVCLSTSCEIYCKKQEETFHYDGTNLVHVLVGFACNQKAIELYTWDLYICTILNNASKLKFKNKFSSL